MHLAGSSDQGAEHHRRCARVIEGGVRRRYVEGELLNKPGQARGLALGKLQHQPGQGGGVDDRVLERAFQALAHQPGVEGVVAVLDENRALGEPQERPAGVSELRRSDEH